MSTGSLIPSVLSYKTEIWTCQSSVTFSTEAKVISMRCRSEADFRAREINSDTHVRTGLTFMRAAYSQHYRKRPSDGNRVPENDTSVWYGQSPLSAELLRADHG